MRKGLQAFSQAPPTPRPLRRRRIDWPSSLPSQTRVQESLHEATWDAREPIVLALDASPYPEDRRRALRLASCCQGAAFHVDPRLGKVRPWVSRCRDRMCPYCGVARSAHAADQLHDAIRTMPRPRFMVLTRKSVNRPLAEQLHSMREAFAKLRRKKEWKRHVKGCVYTIECTRNEDTGLYHPHTHAIYDGEYFPQGLLRRLWHDVTGDSDIVWIQAIDDPRAAAEELAKYIGKPQRVKDWPPTAICEYARATKGARMIGATGNQYHRHITDRDPLPADSPDTYTVPLSRLVTRASQGLPTPVNLTLAIAQRFPVFQSYIWHRVPQLQPPPDQTAKLRHIVNLVRSDEPPATRQRAPPQSTVDKLDARILRLFCAYRVEEQAGNYYAADYRTQVH